MKKFISMVMAAAMVVSLVPATAFAADAATFKVTGDKEYTEETADSKLNGKETWWVAHAAPNAEIQLKVADVDNNSVVGDKWDLTLSFENVEAQNNVVKSDATKIDVKTADGQKTFTLALDADVDKDDSSFDFVLSESAGFKLEEDDIIIIPLTELSIARSGIDLGLAIVDDADVTVEVDGDFGTSDPMTVVAIQEEGIEVTLKKVGEVAEEESKKLESKLTIEANVENFKKDQIIELKLNGGFEFEGTPGTPAGLEYVEADSDEDLAVYKVTSTTAKFVFDREMLVIDAVDAKAGDVAKITVKVKEGDATDGFKGTVTVEAMKVVGEAVTISVDEDEDVPVMYSGVAPTTKRINVESDDFVSLEVTIEESVAGALDVKKDLELMLPEGVFVTDVDVTKDTAVVVNEVPTANLPTGAVSDAEKAFAAAYKEGEAAGFVFDRKTFKDTTDVGNGKDAMELKFKLTLMAVPGFVGDVVLTMDGPAFEDAQEVTIAKFVAPYTVEAQANDLIIDYRNTEVPTTIVVKEAEAGLWADGAKAMDFAFDVKHMEFEDDATITVNEESEMEIVEKGKMGFVVDKESDEEAAVVTISGIELYMERNLPAGAYDLKLGTKAGEEMMTTALFTTEDEGAITKGDNAKKYFPADVADWDVNEGKTEFLPKAGTAKEGWINVVTAGRDADDASFTTKVVVPVGESYIVAGENTVALDVPAYVSAAGYTMLPVRAVSVALGILNNNVLWDQASKTVTILYGQRIITMTVGAKVINVNGSAIPASSSPEVVDGRTFLPMRDLATALGVTDITWDAATKTATLNGNK